MNTLFFVGILIGTALTGALWFASHQHAKDLHLSPKLLLEAAITHTILTAVGDYVKAKRITDLDIQIRVEEDSAQVSICRKGQNFDKEGWTVEWPLTSPVPMADIKLTIDRLTAQL